MPKSDRRATAGLCRLPAVCLILGLVCAGPLAAPAQAQDSTAVAAPALSDEERDSAIRGLLQEPHESPVEFHGFLNFEGFSFQRDAARDIPSFDIHNFFFAAKAPLGRDALLFLEIEYEHGSTVKLDRAFVDWSPHPLLTVRAGRFYVPVSQELTCYWAPIRLMTSRPLLVDITFREWCDTGLELLGRQDWFGYNIGLVNGPQGLTESGIPFGDVRDNNRDKVPFARLNLYPVEGLEAGVAYSSGAYDSRGGLKFRLVEFNSRLRHGPLDVWVEYDRRSGDDEPAPGTPGSEPAFSGDPARRQGYYVQAAFEVLRHRKLVNYLKPVVRYERMEALASGTGSRRVTAGVNWSPAPHLVVKTEYQWTSELGGPRLRNNGAMFSLVADF
ncbi:MAG: hypothetical protein HZB25_04115 [Candidatus Eisenbacteria bacterium]|nr:hypothetical protein [Candidatus Eisenbacteria bacterium]